MPHRQINLPDNFDIPVFALSIREEIQREHHGAIGGVFEGDDAIRCGAGLDGVEDVFDGGLGKEGVVLCRESRKRGLVT